VEPNQVDIIAVTMTRGFEQVLGAVETRLARKFIGDLRPLNRVNRVHDNMPLVHWVSAAHLDVEPLPDPDTAPDPSASNALTKAFGEDHTGSRLLVRHVSDPDGTTTERVAGAHQFSDDFSRAIVSRRQCPRAWHRDGAGPFLDVGQREYQRCEPGPQLLSLARGGLLVELRVRVRRRGAGSWTVPAREWECHDAVLGIVR
jgi:hypothetical protein